MAKLTSEQTEQSLATVPGWTKQGEEIRKTFKFEGFLKAIDFVNAVAKRAEAANHHPDIDIRWNKVVLTLTTHDQGGLTKKDFALALQCNEVANSCPV